MIDTHTHLYDERFDDDFSEMIDRSLSAGVARFLLQAVDSQSHERLFALCAAAPTRFYPFIGLHPTSINENPHWREELARVEALLNSPPAGVRWIGIGEVGLDLYWSKEYELQQREAFCMQVEWALERSLPLVIHTREAWDEMATALTPYRGAGLRGVFHSFSGGAHDWGRLQELGDFYAGIGGPLTYKRSTLPEVVREIGLDRLLLETDAPYLPPTPHRGKRNEPAYLHFVAEHLATLFDCTPQEVDQITTHNAERLFGL